MAKRIGNDSRHRGRGILRALARDTRGNVLILVAASILPLLAMIGSGIDMSRAYMAQARLQQACDAASLAGRRAMSTGTIDATVTAEVNKFFNFNFPQGSFTTATFTPNVSQGDNQSVVVTASTTIPTSIMKIFGFATLPLSATCNAQQNFVNTDVVLVLDNTGSMNCLPSDSATTQCATEKTGSKMQGQRDAVMALYDALTNAQTTLVAHGMRLRYGIVPYSGTVNIGKVVRAVNTSYVATGNYNYQSRTANYQHVETGVTSSYCSGKSGNFNASSRGSSTGTCTYTDQNATGGTFSSWTYQQRSYDISNYVAGNSITIPNQSSTPSQTYLGPSASPGSTTWAGCIEERQTSNAITASSGYSVPSSAYDLDPNRIPDTTAATKWGPYFPEVSYRGDGATYDAYQRAGYAVNSKTQVACPTESKRLAAWTRADLLTYMNGLVGNGGTYSDVGMIWGARLLSRTGIFAADNPLSYGGFPVARYVILITDGYIDTGGSYYSAYGLEQWEHRASANPYPGDDTDAANHQQRFTMMCNAVRGMSASIWVIGFGASVATLDPALQGCADNLNQAGVATNTAALVAKLTQIGNTIGALRLTQ